ncbi:6-phosphogluconolactonase [Buchnera aphidicola (Aphis glycines)]|uniref:6-phosphogluconolactonase n=1 Tax=Buchnera aphidicola (Aphis glycines) TaxID=1265350 RepID=A0A0M4HVC2_9GAMM|nr:6-phosphogluconolactonase [Buchnera aphidicola]ALD15242.1 6-phosphogluconolactonase [Buchnera aphidicola (Aphis glycines)]
MKQIVYIANSTSQTIEAWNLYQDGKMELIQTIKTNGNVQPMNYIKDKNILYAGVRPNNRIIVYNIKKNGYLEQKNESYIPGSPNYISFSPKKNFLFCSSYHTNSLSVIPLNQHGIPKDPIQIIYDINGCHAALMNIKYNILFVTALKEDCIYLYYLTQYGILKHIKQTFIKTKCNAGPRHIQFHPNEDFIYTINELNGTIDVWKIYIRNDIFRVENIQNISIIENHIVSRQYWSADIHLTSCGNFLYVSDRILNSLSLFHIDQNNGTISFVKIYYIEQQPRTFCIDFYDKYIIVASQKFNNFSIYNINQKTGHLKKINTYSTGIEPLWILTYKI